MKAFEFKSNTKKLLKFALEAKNVNLNEMNYTFRVHVNGVEYGFKGDIDKENGIVEFNIPPLNTILTEQYNTGNYTARLDVVMEDYYKSLWKGDVLIEAPKKIVIESTEDNDDKPNHDIKLAKIYESDTPLEEEVIISKDEVKKSRVEKSCL